MSSLLNTKEISAVKRLLILSQFRGTDSTGVAVVFHKKKGKKVKWATHKTLGNSSNFLETNEARSILGKPNLNIILGHTRFTTSGAITVENAHPIQESHIVGCHNGVLHKLNPTSTEDDTKISDSRKFFKLLAEKGLQGAVDESGSGSIAVTYIDKQAKTLNIFRNWARDLYLTHDPSETTFLWASEKEFLEFAIKRDDLKGWKEPWLIEPFTLHTWAIGSSKYALTKITSPVVHYSSTYSSPGSSYSYAIYPYRSSHGEQHTVDPWEDYDGTYCEACWNLKPNCTCEREKVKEEKYIWYGGQISPLFVGEQLLKKGCFSCHKESKVTDIVIWPHYEYYFCKDCSQREWFREYLRHTETYEGRVILS